MNDLSAAPRLPLFDGFPYLLTRVAPSLYHVMPPLGRINPSSRGSQDNRSERLTPPSPAQRRFFGFPGAEGAVKSPRGQSRSGLRRTAPRGSAQGNTFMVVPQKGETTGPPIC